MLADATVSKGGTTAVSKGGTTAVSKRSARYWFRDQLGYEVKVLGLVLPQYCQTPDGQRPKSGKVGLKIYLIQGKIYTVKKTRRITKIINRLVS